MELKKKFVINYLNIGSDELNDYLKLSFFSLVIVYLKKKRHHYYHNDFFRYWKIIAAFIIIFLSVYYFLKVKSDQAVMETYYNYSTENTKVIE